jgi:hypothetical protein
MNNSPPRQWQPSQPHWPPPSDRETEHRLTELEVTTRHHEGHHEEHFQIGDAHRERLNFHERCLLILAGTVSILLQDKWPKLAAILKGVMP